MAISIDTSPANAISDLNDLIVEVRDEMDDDAFAVDKIYRAITRAEAIFNRELRCPKMETEYQLAVTGEQTELPVDFLQLRAVYAEGSPDNPLDSLSPAGLRQRYQGVAGTPKGYAIENRRLIVGPVPVNNDTVNDFEWYRGLSEDEKRLYHQMRPQMVQIDNGDGTKTIVPYNPYASSGAPQAGTLPQFTEEDWEGAGSNASGSF